jgi:tryptophan-rich sensory protein
MNQGQLMLTFIILAFVFAAVIIWQKESLPERTRRPLALFAIGLVTCAFVLIMISFFMP